MQAATQPVCAGCRKRKDVDMPSRASYAFVLSFGNVDVKEMEKKLFCDELRAIPGATLYCPHCRRVQAVSTETDLQKDMISFSNRVLKVRDWQKMASKQSMQ